MPIMSLACANSKISRTPFAFNLFEKKLKKSKKFKKVESKPGPKGQVPEPKGPEQSWSPNKIDGPALPLKKNYKHKFL